MQSTDITVLSTMKQWLSDHHRVWLATVLATYGSSPRQSGSMCAIRDDGVIVGSVSGGCIEEDLRDKLQSNSLNPEHVTIKVYGESLDERDRFRLPCGGTLRLAIEYVDDMTWIDEVLDVINNGQTITRNINKHNLTNHLTHTLPSTPSVTEDEQEIQVTFGPRYTLLLIGAGETSTYLAQFASALDYQVFVADPREEMHALWNDENGTLLKMMPDDAVLHIQPNAYTSIITLTHDPKLDDMALLEALKSEANFIGSLGSARTNAKRRERLALFDLTQNEIERLHGPVGLEIGSKTPAEIAVSIMAQLVLINKSSKIKQLEPKIRVVSNG